MKRILNLILPQERRFFEMLADQAEVAREASEEFSSFVSSFNKSDSARKGKTAKRIKEIENEGDTLTHDIIESIHKSFVTPIDREDIHELAVLLDDLVDIFDEVTHFLILYKIDSVPKEMETMSSICMEMTETVAKAVSDLSNFKKAQEHCIALHEIENKGDDAYHSIIGSLFNDGGEAMHVMKLKDLYDKLEALLDKGEDIANVIENIVVKHA